MGCERTTQWVQCGQCSHEWVGFYVPIDVKDLGKIIEGMRCPACTADSTKIYMKMGNKDG